MIRISTLMYNVHTNKSPNLEVVVPRADFPSWCRKLQERVGVGMGGRGHGEGPSEECKAERL